MSIRTTGKVRGRTVAVTIEGVMSVFERRMRQKLNENGIQEPDPKPDGWYDLDAFVGVLHEVQEDTGENALKKLGQATPDHVDWPSDHDPAAGLAALDDVYQREHRRATGHYEFEQVDESSGRVTAETPYPCPFDEGLVDGTAQACGADLTRVRHSDEACRSEGDDHCVYEIRW